MGALEDAWKGSKAREILTLRAFYARFKTTHTAQDPPFNRKPKPVLEKFQLTINRLGIKKRLMAQHLTLLKLSTNGRSPRLVNTLLTKRRYSQPPTRFGY